jgi:hypothetical protein
MKTTVRALGLVCIISVSSLATTSAMARGGHFGGHYGGHGGGFRSGAFVAGVVLAPLVISSMLYPPVYYAPTYYPQPYYPPVYNAYPQQTYPLQGAAPASVPRAEGYAPQQTAAVGPPVPPAGSAPNFNGAGQSGASWYYCVESKNYYPYVRECASLWRPEPVQLQR